MLRRHRTERTSLGLEAQGYMDAGKLVPDDLVIRMVEAELANVENVIVDGFPRTIPQAQAFDKLIDAKGLKSVAVIFDVDNSVLVERITGRWSNPRTGRVYHAKFNPPKVAGIDDDDCGPLVQRPDDAADVVAKRLKVYDLETAPLIAHYEKHGDFVHVNGLGEIADVTKAIIAKLPDVGQQIVSKT